MMTTDRLLSVFSEIGKNAADMRGCGQLARVTAYAIRDMLPPSPEPDASAFVAYAEDYAMTVHYHAALVHAEDIGRWSIGHSAVDPSLAIAAASHARTHASAQLIGAWKAIASTECCGTAKGGA
jgi:hypothetical protein